MLKKKVAMLKKEVVMPKKEVAMLKKEVAMPKKEVAMLKEYITTVLNVIHIAGPYPVNTTNLEERPTRLRQQQP